VKSPLDKTRECLTGVELGKRLDDPAATTRSRVKSSAFYCVQEAGYLVFIGDNSLDIGSHVALPQTYAKNVGSYLLCWSSVQLILVFHCDSREAGIPGTSTPTHEVALSTWPRLCRVKDQCKYFVPFRRLPRLAYRQPIKTKSHPPHCLLPFVSPALRAEFADNATNRRGMPNGVTSFRFRYR
jgi:hypothetical protein